MIIREGSRYVHAMPAPPRHRVLGLARSSTGPRGLSMWNPQDSPPVTSVTLSHGRIDPRAGAGVRVTSAACGDHALGDVLFANLTPLPGITGEEVQALASSLEDLGRSALWNSLDLRVDGNPTTFQIHRHRDRWWIAVAALDDIAVGLSATDTTPGDVELVTLDPDLPGYEAAPALRPGVGHPADTRARFEIEGLEPVLVRQWAVDALAAGADVPALHRVVDIDLSDRASLRTAFDTALDELGAPRLGEDGVRWQYVAYLARAVVDGELDATRAARRVVWGAADPLGRPERLRPFVEAVERADDPRADKELVEATCRRVVDEFLAT